MTLSVRARSNNTKTKTERWYGDGRRGVRGLHDFDEEGFETEAAARRDLEQRATEQEVDEEMPLTEAYLSIQNPKRVKDQEDDWAPAVAKAKREGYDGIVYRNEFEDKGTDSYIAFYPEQIKSVKNEGAHDPSNPNILKSVKRAADKLKLKSKERLGTEDPENKSPDVDWYARDLQDSGKINESNLLRDYNNGKPALVYQSYIDVNDMPDYALAEEEDEDGGSYYDWDEFRFHSRQWDAADEGPSDAARRSPDFGWKPPAEVRPGSGILIVPRVGDRPEAREDR